MPFLSKQLPVRCRFLSYIHEYCPFLTDKLPLKIIFKLLGYPRPLEEQPILNKKSWDFGSTRGRLFWGYNSPKIRNFLKIFPQNFFWRYNMLDRWSETQCKGISLGCPGFPAPPTLEGKRSKLHGTKVHGARARAFDVFCSQMSWWLALRL